MAPVIANTYSNSGNNMAQMIPFHTLPAGAPVNTTTVTTTSTVSLPPTAATNWSG
jgi:hypothetical protein